MQIDRTSRSSAILRLAKQASSSSYLELYILWGNWRNVGPHVPQDRYEESIKLASVSLLTKWTETSLHILRLDQAKELDEPIVWIYLLYIITDN